MSQAEGPKRIVVLVSGSGTNMVNVVEHCQAGNIPAKVVAVISNQASAPGLEKAEQLGVPAISLPHTDFPDRVAYDTELGDLLGHYQPDLIVLAGFMRILSPEFVRRFTGKLVNIHPSLLPKYKGLHTHRRALENGDSEHGVSVHFVTEELDGGPVILQAKVPVFPGDTEADLQARVQEQEYRIYPLVIGWFCNGRLALQSGSREQAVAMLDGQRLGPQGYAAEDDESK